MTLRAPKIAGPLPMMTTKVKASGVTASTTLPATATAGWVSATRRPGSAMQAITSVANPFKTAQFRLERDSQSLGVTKGQVRALEASRLTPAAATTLHRAALTDLVRLASPFQERGFQDVALAELRSVHGSAAGEIDASMVRPLLPKADEHQRRSLAASAVITLHAKNVLPSKPELLVPVVEQLARYGRTTDIATLERLLKMSTKGGDTATSSAAATAIAQLNKYKTLRVAMFQLEGGQTAGSGIKSYVNPTSIALAKQGHLVDVYLPITADLDPVTKGLTKVVGGEGSIRDVDGKRVTFTLWREGDTAPNANGGQHSVIYFKDDSHFGPHKGIYDQPDGTPFANDSKRMMAGAALSNAAMSKVAAIRKLERAGQPVSTASVRAAEATLTPNDSPQIIQYNDSHFAFSNPMLQFNKAFRDAKPLGVIHQANPAYRRWIPREYVEPMLRSLGGRYLKSLESLPSGNWVDPLEVMANLFKLSTVSDGYKEFTLHGKGAAGPRAQAAIREAEAEGRYEWVVNGIDLAKFDPMNIAGTKQVKAFGLADLSGRVPCKEDLQRSFGFPVDATAPLLSFVHRMTREKGLQNLLKPMSAAADSTPLDIVLKENPKLQILLGGPDPDAQLLAMAKQLEARYPKQVKVRGERLDNRHVMTGTDVFLMPSDEEPCGIAQMEAQALGAVMMYLNHQGPKGTIVPFDAKTGAGTGFAVRPGSPDALLDGLRRSVQWAKGSAQSKERMQRNAMAHAQTFAIERMALNHDALLREAVTEKP